MEQTYKVRVEGLEPNAVWKVWSDVNNWHTWDTDIEWARLMQPFAEGSAFELKPKGGPIVKILITKLEVNKTFTDEAKFPFAKMFSIHKIEQLNGALELSHTVKVSGALKKLWWHLVAKKVAAGLEEQTGRLLERARQLSDKEKAS